MSIDVSYFSFSPSRADNEWPHVIEDLLVLRKKHAGWGKRHADTQAHEQKIVEIKARFEPRVDEIRKKIFSHFVAKGYDVPENVGSTDEDKMEYLKSWGCVYPNGVRGPEKNAPFLQLRTDAPELEDAYDEVIKERDEAVALCTQQYSALPTNEVDIALNLRQQALDHESPVSYLVYENVFDQNQLISDLKSLDIYYGSVPSEYFESPKMEYAFLEALIATCQLQTEQEVPTKAEWVRFFEQIDANTIERLSQYLVEKERWEKDEAGEAIQEYLQAVRPVAKDLKETADAVFLRVYGGANGVEPESTEALLVERALRHAQEYKGLLPPVL